MGAWPVAAASAQRGRLARLARCDAKRGRAVCSKAAIMAQICSGPWNLREPTPTMEDPA